MSDGVREPVEVRARLEADDRGEERYFAVREAPLEIAEDDLQFGGGQPMLSPKTRLTKAAESFLLFTLISAPQTIAFASLAALIAL